jgi:hypothetical protein
MVHQGLVGVRDGDLAQCIVAREVRSVEKHFQIHHVVNDHLKIGRVCRIPAARTADYGVKAGRQRSGERLDSVLCGFIVWIAGG